MGNTEFNGKKFDIWSDYTDDPFKQFIYGVWNNDMHARQYIDQWNGTVAPSKEDAIAAAKRLNDNIK